MKYVGDLITEIRRDTRNEDVPTTDEQVGISTEDFLRYINYAQENVVAIIIAAQSKLFQTTKTIDLEAEEQFYEIDDNVYLGSQIYNLEFSPTGLAQDFYELREKAISYRNDFVGYPTGYFRLGERIGLSPIPQSSTYKARVTYERAPDQVDIRRGTVTAVTMTATAISSLTVDTTDADEDALEAAQYVCVSDAFGEIKMYNIPVTAYDTATGVFTISGGSFTFGDEGTTIVAGDYVTVGQYTTTHSKLPRQLEKYLALYASEEIYRRDVSDEYEPTMRKRMDMEERIENAFKDMPKDDGEIQIDNWDLVLGDY